MSEVRAPTTLLARLASLRGHLHFAVTALLAALLLPVCRRAGLHYDAWAALTTAVPGFWTLALRSAVLGTGLYVLCTSRDALTSPFVKSPLRLGLGALAALLAVLLFGSKAGLYALDALLAAELVYRRGRAGLRGLGAVALASAYFFVGVHLVFDYNDVLASLRDPLATDAALQALDAKLLFGHTVSSLSSALAHAGHAQLFAGAEALYLAMFLFLGAGILLVGLDHGAGRALQLVGAMLTAYFLAMLIFALWPSHGPYALCPDHFQTLPAGLKTRMLQEGMLGRVKALFHHQGVMEVQGGYFISFPCLHVALPLIVAWFLRYRRRASRLVLAYTAVMAPAVLLLEWHYLVDMLAAPLVSALAIALVDVAPVQSWRPAPAVEPAEGA